MRRLITTLLLGALVTAPALALDGVRYAEDRAPAIVNPVYATSMSEARLNELVFEGLFSDDMELRSAPRLAERIELAADRKSAKVYLRKGVGWHDAEPFTSADVTFTINTMKSATTASTEAGRVSWIASATAEGDHVVVLTFEGEEYAPEDKLHFKILPQHRFADAPMSRTHEFRTRPVGTGPWMVVGFNDDNSITMSRNLKYWGEARVPEFTMREVADKNYQAKLLIYESLEALVRVLPRDLATLQNNRNVELYPYQTNSWWYVGFNLRDKRLEDTKVREAVQQMVDISSLLAPIGTGDLVTGPFVPSSPFYNHDVKAPGANPAAAAKLLQEAGYTREGQMWMKDGKPLTLRVATQQNLETAQDVVINLQAQLQNQGIQVEPVFLTVAEWKQKIWRDSDFDLILSQWSFDRNEDIYEQFHSKGTRNFTGYASKETDRLLDEAREAADPQQKKQLLRQVHAQVAADDPMIFLWTLDSYSALSVRVKDVVVHPFYFFTWAQDWQLE